MSQLEYVAFFDFLNCESVVYPVTVHRSMAFFGRSSGRLFEIKKYKHRRASMIASVATDVISSLASCIVMFSSIPIACLCWSLSWWSVSLSSRRRRFPSSDQVFFPFLPWMRWQLHNAHSTTSTVPLFWSANVVKIAHGYFVFYVSFTPTRCLDLDGVDTATDEDDIASDVAAVGSDEVLAARDVGAATDEDDIASDVAAAGSDDALDAPDVAAVGGDGVGAANEAWVLKRLVIL
ncbi:hypothetical protein DPMN_135384 [Dreissena polymorpha]|uniref:Uncharacterized protein n=1 Tax=Dreissena polymorpha TaxID=45954 RepID=A0A9D4JBL8_DREPO|nr:hypothetical protein DPMN_135384 [Dreissena polymorpha]